MEAMQQAAESGRQLTFEGYADKKNLDKGGLRTPRFYYRRDLAGSETIVAAYR
jgi:hypothetical protein